MDRRSPMASRGKWFVKCNSGLEWEFPVSGGGVNGREAINEALREEQSGIIRDGRFRARAGHVGI